MHAIRVGSRAEVFHGHADHTSGGLKKSNLKKTKDGRLVSKKASAASKKSMSPLFKAFMSMAKKSKNGDFSRMPKKGTKQYKDVVERLK